MESVFQYLQTTAVESDLQMRGHVFFRQRSYSQLRRMGLVLHIVGSAQSSHPGLEAPSPFLSHPDSQHLRPVVPSSSSHR